MCAILLGSQEEVRSFPNIHCLLLLFYFTSKCSSANEAYLGGTVALSSLFFTQVLVGPMLLADGDGHPAHGWLHQ